MNEGWKASVKLGAKVLVVLLLPLLLISYVDSQPVVVESDDDDEGTRSIAIVDEDRGWESESETIELGKRTASLLNAQDDYSWTVLSRSAAEQGFSDQVYDAIIYVPSSFTENIMMFREEVPSKASINYVIQPNLVAKERQRVHREMAIAQNKINQEMSMIYWSYVSQEVDMIREQFDLIVAKEVEFQDEMYSFYSPSSESLANEIERHKNGLENILNETSRINEVSNTSATTAAEAEDQISSFTKALELYKEYQFEQQQLIQLAQAENKTTIQNGVETYDTTLADGKKLINDRLSMFSTPEFANDTEIILQSLGAMEQMLEDGDAVLYDWSESFRNQRRQVDSINEEFVRLYQREVVSEVTEELEVAARDLKGSPDEKGKAPELPSRPKEGKELDLKDLEEAIKTLEDELNEVRPKEKEEIDPGPDEEGDETPADSDKNEDSPGDSEEEPPSEPKEEPIEKEPSPPTKDTNWSGVDSQLDKLKKTLDELENRISDRETNKQEWEDHVDAIEEAYRELEETKKILNSAVVNEVISKQDKLSKQLVKKSDIVDKDVSHVITFLQALHVYEAALDQQQDVKIVENVLSNERVNQRLDNLFSANISSSEELQTAFNRLINGSGETDGSIKKVENNFYDYVSEAELLIEAYDSLVADEHDKIISGLEEVITSSQNITNQLQTVNAETFEWEQSPSLQYLDSTIVVNVQQSASSDLKTMAEMVGSLDDSQNTIVGSTDEMQTRVADVQEQSDDLNNRWSLNVDATELIRDDVHNVLGNTVVDGQENPFVYNYLSSPVEITGHVEGQVLSETADRMPPVVMFVIVLISGLLIGFLTHYYSNNTLVVQAGLFLLLNLAVGFIISIYGLNIYNLNNTQSVLWSIFTILLLFACSNIIRGGLFVGPFAGWLTSIVMIVFFITPLLNIIVPEFSINHPVETAYMSIQYAAPSPPYGIMAVLFIIIVLVSIFIYTWQVKRDDSEVKEDEQKAS